MIKEKIGLDWDDFSIVPATISEISSRSEVDCFRGSKLPLFTAPMDSVLNYVNINEFEGGVNICLPRNLKYSVLKNDNYFYSFGLDEVIEMFGLKQETDGSFIQEEFLELTGFPPKILIDVANGHMRKLYEVAKYLKSAYGSNLTLMVGNIANSETYTLYCHAGVDFIRVGIGGGASCITSSNTGIHYPYASLIDECYQASLRLPESKRSKIIADGGFRKYSDIIKALATGADYVMIGSILSKTIESCGYKYLKEDDKYTKIASHDALNFFNEGGEVYTRYRGMSTKEVQEAWGRKKLKTSEGIVRYNKVEYSAKSWIENFTDYLKSSMSYTGYRNLDDFRKSVKIRLSESAKNRFND